MVTFTQIVSKDWEDDDEYLGDDDYDNGELDTD
jgi:hypothetical protein